MSFIGGHDIRKLADTYGTPLLVYDEDAMRKRLNEFVSSFKSEKLETGVLYASKAFSCKAMVSLIDEYGLYLDVVSAGELFTAYKTGYDCSKIFFHGNNKTLQELKMAMQMHVGTIVVDNLMEAEELAELAKEADYPVHTLLRVNPGIEAHTHKYIVTAHVDSKFGISFLNEEELVETIKVLQNGENIVFDGLHAHIGSQIFDIQAFLEEIKKLFAYSQSLKEKYGIDFHTINLGGGFGVKYTEEDKPVPIEKVCQSMIQTCEEEQEKTCPMIQRVLIEPGRSIVAEAGYSVYTIGYIKKTPNKLYAFVDGGMNDNIRPALYQAKYDAFIEGKEEEEKNTSYTIAGKCCESGDILIESIELPKAEKGDLLVMKTTGAYGYSMASHYNKIPLPAVVFASEKETREVIERETFEHMISLEK
ncbi:MAG: diaminopimelate decarboxylase [Solobacterium sp.]|nr:diaminopimelate decarboxylase [Solobacterium sp.]